MDCGKLKQEARQALHRADYPARKLALMHTGAALALSLVLSLISFFLGQYADSEGGLGAMGMQAFVGTVQMALPLITLAVSPFWDAGFQNAALEYSDGKKVGPGSLLEGFRCWKPILSATVFVGLLFVGRGFLAAFLSSQLIMLTPLAAPIYKAGMQQMADPNLDLMSLLGDAVVPFVVTYCVIFAVVFALLALPVYYRYRMVNYVVLKEPQVGGLQAMFISRGLTFHRRRELFKLDLGFWWFYGLQLLISVLCYGDLILPMMGIPLPVSPEVASWGFLLLSMAAQLVLYVWAKPLVEVTWAKAFENVALQTQTEPLHPAKKESPHPWDY